MSEIFFANKDEKKENSGNTSDKNVTIMSPVSTMYMYSQRA